MEAAHHRREAGYSTGSAGMVCVMLTQIRHTDASRKCHPLTQQQSVLHYEPFQDTQVCL